MINVIIRLAESKGVKFVSLEQDGSGRFQIKWSARESEWYDSLQACLEKEAYQLRSL